jgi:hypothetical protein
MLHWKSGSNVIACAVIAVIACSPSRTEAASTAGAGAAGASNGMDTTGVPAIACSKVYSQADVAGLLMPPVTVQPTPGGVAWCRFGNDFSGDITLSVGSNESIETMWDEATLTSDSTKFAPLPGVGDKAVFEVGTDALNPELASKKGQVYCIVTYDRGTSDHYKKFQSVGGAEIGKKLGALCNKAFATVRG